MTAREAAVSISSPMATGQDGTPAIGCAAMTKGQARITRQSQRRLALGRGTEFLNMVRSFSGFGDVRRGEGEGAWGIFRVSGNGTRFVWHGGDAQQEQVVEAALVDGVETGLVAMDEAELRRIGQVGKGGGDAAQLVFRLLGADGVIEEAGFDGPDTAEAPGGGDHLLDKAELDAVGGREPSEMLIEQGFEALLRLVGKDEALGEEPVANGVLGRVPLTFRSLGSQRAGAVGPR